MSELSDRRSRIADAGIYLIAHRGVRALTHRSVDELLGLPGGSTSYYARSRRDLLGLIAQRLAEQVDTDFAAVTVPATLSPAGAAEFCCELLDRMLASPERYRTRLALLLECREDPELSAALCQRPEPRRSLETVATEVLRALDAPAARTHAADLVALMDSFMMQRVICGAQLDERRVLRGYLAGLCA